MSLTGESKADDTNYTACSIPYSCGKIRNIGYPFWGEDRPKLCGIPDLKLKCYNDAYTRIDVYSNGYAALRVLDINTSSNTIVVDQDTQLYQQCSDQQRPKNITLNPSLKPHTGFRDITLVYDCANKACANYSTYKHIKCYSSNGTNDPVYYDLNDQSNLAKSCSCKSSLTFPLDDRAFNESRTRNAPLENVLKQWSNITLSYTANFSACSECVESGGRCGSSEDTSLGRFVCYCRDGPQPLTCPSGGSRKLKIILPLGGVGVVLVLAAIVVIWHCMRRKHGTSNFVDRCASLECSASDLQRAGEQILRRATFLLQRTRTSHQQFRSV